jgi:hypothetical protein
MSCSHVFEFRKLIDDYVYECATFFKVEQRVSSHRCKDTPCSRATQGLMPCLVPSVFYDFSKNPDNCVENDRTSERFFGRKPDLARSKGATARSKLLVPTPPQLRYEDLRARPESSGFHPTSFQKAIRLTAWTPVQKSDSKRQNHARFPLEPLEFSGATNEWLLLAI